MSVASVNRKTADRQTTEKARRPGRSSAVAERCIDLNERLWRRLPQRLLDTRPARAYGAGANWWVRRSSDREMYLGTIFFRNRPALELMRRIVAAGRPDRTVRMTVLGCSIGAEVYSMLWTLRRALPDFEIRVHGIDTSENVLEVARRGEYGPGASDIVVSPIFERLSAAERQEMFDWTGARATVKPWLKDGVRWLRADACDPTLSHAIGIQDLVVASNFLCHMDERPAETCLRNVANLVVPGGYVFVSGVDLNVRTRVAVDLGWEPVAELRKEIHEGDPLVRGDWPWRWWGLEPFDEKRRDWEVRYSAFFRIESP